MRHLVLKNQIQVLNIFFTKLIVDLVFIGEFFYRELHPQDYYSYITSTFILIWWKSNYDEIFLWKFHNPIMLSYFNIFIKNLNFSNFFLRKLK